MDIINGENVPRLQKQTTSISNKSIIYFIHPQYAYKLSELEKYYPQGKIIEMRDDRGNLEMIIYKID